MGQLVAIGSVLDRKGPDRFAVRRSLANLFGQFTPVAILAKVIEELPFRLWLCLQEGFVGPKRTQR